MNTFLEYPGVCFFKNAGATYHRWARAALDARARVNWWTQPSRKSRNCKLAQHSKKDLANHYDVNIYMNMNIAQQTSYFIMWIHVDKELDSNVFFWKLQLLWRLQFCPLFAHWGCDRVVLPTFTPLGSCIRLVGRGRIAKLLLEYVVCVCAWHNNFVYSFTNNEQNE